MTENKMKFELGKLEALLRGEAVIVDVPYRLVRRR